MRSLLPGASHSSKTTAAWRWVPYTHHRDHVTGPLEEAKRAVADHWVPSTLPELLCGFDLGLSTMVVTTQEPRGKGRSVFVLS